LTPEIRAQRQKSLIFKRSDQIQRRRQTAWKQNPTKTTAFHESIAILLKNAPFFESPDYLQLSQLTPITA